MPIRVQIFRVLAALLVLLSAQLLDVRAACADVQGTVGTPTQTGVRCEYEFTNETGLTANDFEMYVYIQELSNVTVTGAAVSCQGAFTNVALNLSPDDGRPNPPGPIGPGNHGCSIALGGGTVAPGASIKIITTLWMTERNQQRTKDLRWTFDDVPLPGPQPPPNRGWDIGDASNLDGSNYRHVVCIMNDDDAPALLTELRLLASMDFFEDMAVDIDWSAIPPVQDTSSPPEPPVVIGPHGMWCYDLHTVGSYLGGHIYLRYDLVPQAFADRGAMLDAVSYGDHPVTDLCDDPTCSAFPPPPLGLCLFGDGCRDLVYEYDCVVNMGGEWTEGEECASLTDVPTEDLPRPSFELGQIAPNPFRGATQIRFMMQEAGTATLEVFNVAGERVAVLVAGAVPAGSQVVMWNGLDQEGRRAPAGVYLCRLRTGSLTAVRKMVLMAED